MCLEMFNCILITATHFLQKCHSTVYLPVPQWSWCCWPWPACWWPWPWFLSQTPNPRPCSSPWPANVASRRWASRAWCLWRSATPVGRCTAGSMVTVAYAVTHSMIHVNWPWRSSGDPGGPRFTYTFHVAVGCVFCFRSLKCHFGRNKYLGHYDEQKYIFPEIWSNKDVLQWNIKGICMDERSVSRFAKYQWRAPLFYSTLLKLGK